jgi:hypothetical protein
MKTRGGGIVGYNVQTVVDAEHHLIVSHEVTNRGSDRHQLTTMASQAREALGVDALTAVADRGYYKSEEILACEQAGISALLPRPRTSDKRSKGLFERAHFRYLPDTDEYVCPAGERLIWRFRSIEDGLTLDTYWSSACPGCPLKQRCTPAEQRRIRRWEHEQVLEAVQARLDRNPDAMRLRRQTAEHPFGTLKAWMGATHFLTRTLAHVRTEMSLHVLAYNLKRVMNLIGVIPLIEAVRA